MTTTSEEQKRNIKAALIIVGMLCLTCLGLGGLTVWLFK